MTIITQQNELVNYNSIRLISAVIGTFEDKDSKNSSPMEVYAIVAYDALSDMDDETIQLGVYASEDECREAYKALIGALRRSENVFEMPQPSNEELTVTNIICI